MLTISGLLTLNIASPLGTSIDEKLRVKSSVLFYFYCSGKLLFEEVSL